MTDQKVTALTENTDPVAADVLPIVDDPGGTPASQKVTVQNLIGYLVTTAGDILYATASRTLARLGIGSATQVLKGGASAPSWGVCPTADVATTAGDIFYATAADTPARLALGTQNYVLTAGASAPAWAAASAGKLRLTLPPSAGYPPDDTTGSMAAQLQIKLTSDATDPQVRWPELLFDTTTEEHWYWSFAMPSNYGSAPILDVYYKAASATSGTAAFNCKLMAVTDADAQDVDADEFAAEQTTAGSATVPATAGYMAVISITIDQADSVAANDFVVLGLFRDVSVDNAAGDLEVVMVVLRYTGS